MSTKEMLDQMKMIQNNLLKFIDEENDIEEHFQNIKEIFEDHQILDKYLVLVIHLIAQISNNHHQCSNFISKIERILLIFKEEMKNRFVNSALFYFFKNNKRILLFLIKEGIMTIDKYIFSEMMKIKYKSMKYRHYFLPEIKPFISTDTQKSQNDDLMQFYSNYSDNFDDFQEKRKNGQNDGYISQIIREDKIDDFISHISEKNISLNSSIGISPFETNLFLLQKSREWEKKEEPSHPMLDICVGSDYDDENEKESHPSLIEYAAFFGSIRIFKYLESNGAKLKSSIWEYAIHSNNQELLCYLEEKKIPLENESYEKIYIESIKCHHNSIAEHIMNNHLDKQKFYRDKNLLKILKYFNFDYINDEDLNNSTFYDLCRYDYSSFVEELMKTTKIDANKIRQVSLNSDSSDEDPKNEKTPLHISIEKNNYETIKVLLSNNQIDPNLESSIQKNRFSFASNKEWVDFEDSNDSIVKHISPLIFSIETRNNDILKLLLSSERVDINHKCKYTSDVLDNRGENYAEIPAIYTAVNTINIEAVKLLVSNEKLEKDSLIIFKHYDPDGNGIYKHNIKRTALHRAIEKGSIEIVKLLIESEKFDVNYPKTFCSYWDEHEEWGSVDVESIMSPIHIAILKNHTDIAELLLSCNDIDINAYYFYEKCDASFNHWKVWSDTRAEGFEDKFKVESEKNLRSYSFEQWRKTPLHLAIDKNNQKIAEILISNEKIDVITPFEIIKKAYHLQSRNNTGEDAELLVKKSTFFYAIEKNKLNIIKLLLSNADIDINSPFEFFCKPCQFEINDYVEEKPQIKNETKPKGEIIESHCLPLNYAINKNKKDIVTLLLTNKNIDVNKKTEINSSDADGQNAKYDIIPPLFYAYQKKNMEALMLLLSNKNIEKDPIRSFCSYEEKDKIKTKTEKQLSLLFYPIGSKNYEYFSILYGSGLFDINKKYSIVIDKTYSMTNEVTNEKLTALHYAIQNNNVEVIRLLLSNENVDANDSYLIESNKITVDDVSQLTNEKVPKEHITSFLYKNEKKTALQYAIELEKNDIIEILLSNDKIDVNNPCEYITKKHVKKQEEQDIETFEIITPLVKAIQLNSIGIVNSLLEKNDVDTNIKYHLTSYPYDFEKDERNESEKNEKDLTPLESKEEIINLFNSK